MMPEEFVELLRPHAERVFEETGIPVEIMLAQAALETGWLQKTVRDKRTGQDSLNLFNIKGEGPAGSVTVDVVEYIASLNAEHHALYTAIFLQVVYYLIHYRGRNGETIACV